MLQKELLKQKLLKTNYFIDNEYLSKYLELICNYTENIISGYSEIHHILQKYYFKLLNLKLDNTENNKIRMLYKDHVYAHYLLYFCTIDKLKAANSRAVSKMTKVIIDNKKIFRNSEVILLQSDLEKIQNYMNIIS